MNSRRTRKVVWFTLGGLAVANAARGHWAIVFPLLGVMAATFEITFRH
jgi:hypothetical protein